MGPVQPQARPELELTPSFTNREDPQRAVVGTTRSQSVEGRLLEAVDPKRPPAGS